ncbi:MAG: acetyl-CoA carboxylase biotin carboxyl carrier protein subunit [Clostridiales bacterium 43-6]|nr:MAG: acetyl-CoA carboxylase biotin carboxyl carrier protein subunit [Clostridiales bacterium 43-6]
MIYTVKINDKEYEVEVEKGVANVLKTTVITQQAAPVAAPQSAVTAPSPQQSQTAVAGGTVIKSPMPGTILDIKTGAGTQVKKGQLLLILEAMKMENEIVAPSDGVVVQVIAAKGASVATDDALLVIQ